MKRFLILFMAAFIPIAAPAQDKKSQFETFTAIETMSASFIQTNYYAGLDNYTREGKVYVVRPEKALWDYESPAEYYLLEKNAIYHYSEELEQLIKLNVNPNNMDDPTAILLGIFLDSATIKNRFHVEEKPDQITLTPKNNIGMNNIIITMKGDTLKSISSQDTSGNSILIDFTGVVTGKPVPEKIFEKSVPEGTSFYEQ